MKRTMHAKQPAKRSLVAGSLPQRSGIASIAMGKTGSRSEREAESVAEHGVTPGRLSGSHHDQLGITPLAKNKVTGSTSENAVWAEPISAHGQPLAGELRHEVNRLFDYDFSKVRIHNGSVAEASARSLQARAYTVGNDIVFNASEYAPATTTGRRLLLHELTHVVQQGGQPLLVQRTPISEGVAQAAEANPSWRFGRTTRGHGFRMNPAYWRVTYHLRSGRRTRPIHNGRRRTALDNVQRFLGSHASWRRGATVERIEVRLLPGVSASAAARDLTARGSRSRYSFECFTAASLVQFMGRYRSLRRANPTTADALFDQRYSDILVTLPYVGSPVVRMGGADLVPNLGHISSFSLRQLLDSSNDMGLLRGDWVYLSNSQFITSGAFQGENAIYIGRKRFFGHGIGVFTCRQYAARLRRDQRVTLTVAQILDQVSVGPRYRPPAQAAASQPASAPASQPSSAPASQPASASPAAVETAEE